MPSYRLRLEVGLMRGDASPADVLPAAAAAAARLAYVESRDVDVAAGAAWVQLRVTIEESAPAEEDAAAVTVLAGVRDAVERLAATGRAYVLRREPGGGWAPVPC